jgi:hypothetical protein
LNDVTACYDDVDCSGVISTITPTPTSVCDNSTGNTATGPAGYASYAWSIGNGSIVGSTTSQSVTYTAGASGNVTLTLTVVAANDCQDTDSINVPIVVTPAQPTITPGGPTTFCAGGSVTLTSSSATGNQWYLDGNPLGGETGQTYVASASGSYTVIASTGVCASPASSATTVTVNPLPATPTITPGGPTTFCTGGSVTLTSSAASGNQWLLDDNPIGGETNQNLVVTASGNYTVTTTDGNSCTSAPSSATTVTVNPIPSTPTITPGPASAVAGLTGNAASAASAGAGATYNWTIGNGTITAGTGTANITFTAGAVGTLTLDVTVTTSAVLGSDSASVTVTAVPPAVTVTSVTPPSASSSAERT